ncbi:unnamed protein product [Chironomus riparius]|uniref:Serpin domain-containing protein n=1 Tax=Chironomus riparius TaxID=315576 RepID=A0A9N9S6Q6_9DIPT|nr:unnamed protein product [Chironomus riparius]
MESNSTTSFKNTPVTTNFLISPLSLDYVMNLLFLGTTKTTFTAVKAGLKYPKDFTIKAIEDNLLKWSKSVKMINDVEVATKIYVNNSLTIKKAYKMSIKKILNSDLEKIAFIKSKPATTKINKWISDSTRDMIQNMIGPGVIDKSTLMILVNCIYFGGKWTDPFLSEFNYEGNFTTEDGSTKSTEFMYQEARFNFSSSVDELKGASAVSLNYEDTSVSMLFVLPPKGSNLKSWLSSIKSINWAAVDKSLEPTNVKLSIPKFNITYDTDMKDTLKSMGLSSIFDDQAHLDKIFSKRFAKVSNLFHKNVLTVNEIGTVAVAAAVLKISDDSLPINPQKFTANRPFVFFIRSGPTLIFIGQYVG